MLLFTIIFFIRNNVFRTDIADTQEIFIKNILK